MANGPIASGIKSGIQFAQQSQQINLQRQQMDLRQKQFEFDKQNRDIKVGTMLSNQIFKIASDSSPKTRDARVKYFVEQAKQLGIDVHPVNQAAFKDEETLKKIAKVQLALNGIAGTDEHDLLLSEIAGVLSEDDFTGAIDRVIANEAGFKKIKLQQQGQQKKAEVKAVAKQTKERVDIRLKLQDRAAKITEAFRPQTEAVDKIRAIGRRGVEAIEDNPQLGIQLVRLANPLSEARPSIVRAEEFQVIREAQGILNRAETQIKGLKTGEKIGKQVAQDIINATEMIAGAIDESKRKSLSPIRAETELQRFSEAEQKAVFGTNNMALFKERVRKQTGITQADVTRAIETLSGNIDKTVSLKDKIKQAENKLKRKITRKDIFDAINQTGMAQ